MSILDPLTLGPLFAGLDASILEVLKGDAASLTASGAGAQLLVRT
jgi:hypothetical protein